MAEAQSGRRKTHISKTNPFTQSENGDLRKDTAPCEPVSDDPQCEGFTPHNTCPKSPQKEMVETIIPSTQDSKDPSIACPKTQQPDKKLVQTALSIKKLKGSVVREKVCCGKPSCHCQSGALHGPYPYLHYYSNGKVKRRYLSKAVSALLSHSDEELERMLLRQTVLGQGGAD